MYSDNVRYNMRGYGIPLYNRIYNVTVRNKVRRESSLLHVATNDMIAGYLLRVPKLTHGLAKLALLDQYGRALSAAELSARQRGLREYTLFAEYFHQMGTLPADPAPATVPVTWEPQFAPNGWEIALLNSTLCSEYWGSPVPP